jgi:hypothetical protein
MATAKDWYDSVDISAPVVMPDIFDDLHTKGMKLSDSEEFKAGERAYLDIDSDTSVDIQREMEYVVMAMQVYQGIAFLFMDENSEYQLEPVAISREKWDEVGDAIESADDFYLNALSFSSSFDFLSEIADDPLLISTTRFRHNSIGTPEISIAVDNNSDKTIDAFNVRFFLYDNFNNPVGHYGRGANTFDGIFQWESIAPRSAYDGSFSWWTLYGFDSATKYTGFVTSVHFTDNTTWEMAPHLLAEAKEFADEHAEDFTR